VTGEFVVKLAVVLGGYGVVLGSLPLIRDRLPLTSSAISIPLQLAVGCLAWRFIRQSGFPLHVFGLTLRGLLRSSLEALVFTLPVLAVVTGLKAVLLWLNGAAGAALIEHPDLAQRLATTDVAVWLSIYGVSSAVQELIVRGALQSGLELFLPGARRGAVILVAAILFSLTHLHLSPTFALTAFVPGLFWGWLYARQHNLAGVTLSHVAVGGYVFFVLGANVTG
jgi:membrane protease YdiL (CAAX protease family)